MRLVDRIRNTGALTYGPIAVLHILACVLPDRVEILRGTPSSVKTGVIADILHWREYTKALLNLIVILVKDFRV